MKYLVLFSILIISNSCFDNTFSKDEELTLSKQTYTGNELRIDGYYYHVSSIDGRIISIAFFYNDGVVFYMNGDGSKIQDLRYWDDRALSNEWINIMKNDKFCWGIYNIENENIVIQRWGGSIDGVHPVITSYGKIVNDTTYKITKTMDSQTNDEWSGEIIYNYRVFSPKPDSTNVFIE